MARPESTSIEPTDKPPEAPITILLVDDDEDCRMLVRDAIEVCDADHQNNVVEVHDGQAAIDYLKRSVSEGKKPGLIFLDVEMPRMNGIEALQKIKSDPSLKDIPVVMLTGVAEEEYMQRAAVFGANSYTIKPASADEFIKTVSNSATYWLRVHQYPTRHLPQEASRR
jgi:CheY-like chemotaxis protein